jgi:hypothetical protein
LDHASVHGKGLSEVAEAASAGKAPVGSGDWFPGLKKGCNSHFCQQARINVIEIAGNSFHAEALLDAPSSCIPHFPHDGAILGKPAQPSHEGAGVAGRNQLTGNAIQYDLGVATYTRRQHRTSCMHRLQQGIGEILMKGWEDKEVRNTLERGDIGTVPEKADAPTCR